MIKKPLLLFTSAALSLVIASCSSKNPITGGPVNPPAEEVPTDNDPLLFGNPTNAKKQVSLTANYLKDNGYYKIAYSKERGIPVWVGWHLQKEDVGSVQRSDNFRPDTDLPAGWKQVQTSDYTSSGFDRGHNCPSGDRTSTAQANSATFLMTNITPFAPNLNQGAWEGLENHIRTNMVGGNNEAYIFSGAYGKGGIGSTAGTIAEIGSNSVAVPKQLWKVVVVIPKGNNDLTRISSDATVLAVDMPNDNTKFSTANKEAWRNYIVSLKELEANAKTFGVNLNFFQNIKTDAVRNALKEKKYQ